MKKITTLALFVLLTLLLSSLSCEETISPVDDNNIGGLIEGEKLAQEISNTFNGNDLNFTFNNGISLNLKAADNLTSKHEKVTVARLEGERYFNAEGHFVFDFSKTKSPYTFSIDLTIPKDLDDEDIGLVMYSPSTSGEELDAFTIDFTYNTNTGVLTAGFTAPTSKTPTGSVGKIKNTIQSGNPNYSRLVLSWSLRSELADGSRQRVIQMPYYEQAGNTCWAACTKMLGRTYSTIHNHEQEIRVHDIVKYMGHRHFDVGLGIYAFRTYIPRYLKSKTNIEYVSSSFISTSSLRSEIVKRIDNNQPMILNLTYPGVGKHQLIVVGYELELVSLARTKFKVLYHNPQNVAGESLYRWAEYDWLMKDKWRTELIQIVYAKDPLPKNAPMQTLATPIFDKPLMDGGQSVGELAFMVRRQLPDGSLGEIPIHKVYDQQSQDGYRWVMRAPGAGNIEVIPDTAQYINLKQAVFNAEPNPKNQSLLIEAYDIDTGERVYREQEFETYIPGTNYHSTYIPLDDFFDAAKERSFRVHITLLSEGGKFLDGYNFRFKLAPRKVTEINFQLRFEIEQKLLNTPKTEGIEPYESVKEYSLIIPSLLMKGDGLRYSGVDERGEFHLELDNENDPSSIRSLTIKNIRTTKLGSYDLNYRTIIEFKNISINPDDKKMVGTIIKRSGNQVCGFISDFEDSMNTASPSMINWNMIDYICTSSSLLEISLLKVY